MSPAVASSRPAIRRSAVLLPQPDGPTRTRNSLSWIWIVRSLTARTSPNTLLTWSRVTPAIGISSTRNRSRAAVDGHAPCAAPDWQRRVRSIPQTEIAVKAFLEGARGRGAGAPATLRGGGARGARPDRTRPRCSPRRAAGRLAGRRGGAGDRW